jgi:hypothetical protein
VTCNCVLKGTSIIVGWVRLLTNMSSRPTLALTSWFASLVQSDPRAVYCNHTSATVFLYSVIREMLLLFQRVIIKTRVSLLLLLSFNE